MPDETPGADQPKRGPGRPKGSKTGSGDLAAARRARQGETTPAGSGKEPVSPLPSGTLEPTEEESRTAFVWIQTGFSVLAAMIGPEWALPSDMKLPEGMTPDLKPPSSFAVQRVGRPAALVMAPMIGAAASPWGQLAGALGGHLFKAGQFTWRRMQLRALAASKKVAVFRDPFTGGPILTRTGKPAPLVAAEDLQRAAGPTPYTGTNPDRGPEAERENDPPVIPIGSGFAFTGDDGRPAPGTRGPGGAGDFPG